MKIARRTPALLLAVFCATFFLTGCANRAVVQNDLVYIDVEETPDEGAEEPDTVVLSTAIPPMGKWMLRPDKNKANWLGMPYRNKVLHEPINVIICDAVSQTPEEAGKRLLASAHKAGYLDRYGHSSDYYAYVDGALVPPFPGRKQHSFSNQVFAETNNHGRIFGPVPYDGKFWFVAAFSREKISLVPITHKYVSFNQARDGFAWSLDETGQYKVKKFVYMGNTLLQSESASSGDHDGLAIMLEAAN